MIASLFGAAAILDHDAVAAQSGHKVDGSMTHSFSLTDGVCGRTAQVRDKLVDLVKDGTDATVTLDCSDWYDGYASGGADRDAQSFNGGPAGVFGGDRMTGLKRGRFRRA